MVNNETGRHFKDGPPTNWNAILETTNLGEVIVEGCLLRFRGNTRVTVRELIADILGDMTLIFSTYAIKGSLVQPCVQFSLQALHIMAGLYCWIGAVASECYRLKPRYADRL